MRRFLATVLALVLMMLGGATVFAGETTVIRQSIDDADWYPLYYYMGAEKKIEGLFADLNEELFVNELGWQPKIVPRPWPRAQSDVEINQTDFFVTAPTTLRDQYTLRTALPLFRLYMKLYTYADHPQLASIKRIKTIQDIKALDLVLVSNYGNGWHRSNIEEQGVRTEWVRGDEEIIRFLALKRADAMIEVEQTMSHRIEKMGLSEQLVKTEATFGPIDFYIMVGKKSPFASRIDEINSALQRMHDRGVFQQLLLKYN